MLLFNYIGVSVGYNVFVIYGKLYLIKRTVLWGGLVFSVSLLILISIDKFDAINVALLILMTEFLVAIYRVKLFCGVIKSTLKF